MDLETPYAALSPDTVLDAVEAAGFRCDGRLLALNSYENRVYQIGIDDAVPIIAKFYRPLRWSDAAIGEEHAFALELAALEIPVVAPIVRDGVSLHRYMDFRFALFERRGGRWPELGTAEEREWIGRFLGRIHAVGRTQRFGARASMSIQSLGHASRQTVLEGDWMPDYLAQKYADISQELLEAIEDRAASWSGASVLRIHGDCHRGNVIWSEAGPHFVDLDDCTMGPAIQDIWMLLAGSGAEMRVQLRDMLQGYEQFMPFDLLEVRLIESLRALRMMHYSAWIARRWHDPAFPQAFPWFASARYWEDHHRALEEQMQALLTPPLDL